MKLCLGKSWGWCQLWGNRGRASNAHQSDLASAPVPHLAGWPVGGLVSFSRPSASPDAPHSPGLISISSAPDI